MLKPPTNPLSKAKNGNKKRANEIGVLQQLYKETHHKKSRLSALYQDAKDIQESRDSAAAAREEQIKVAQEATKPTP